MYTRGGPELNCSIRFIIRTAATNIVKPREGIAEKKAAGGIAGQQASEGNT